MDIQETLEPLKKALPEKHQEFLEEAQGMQEGFSSLESEYGEIYRAVLDFEKKLAEHTKSK